VKRLALEEHRDAELAQKAYNAYANARLNGVPAEPPSHPPPPQSTPFENVRDAVGIVLQLENRVAEITNKLLGAMPEQQSDSRDLPPSNGAPIFELNEHASDITAAVRRMHEVLDRFNPVLPA
jgi:hypothetical protein